MWDQLLVPGQISILHGDKDYCSFFPQSDKAGLGLLALRRIAGRKYASMVLYMQAEVSYEYNRLDEALTACRKVSAMPDWRKMNECRSSAISRWQI